VAYNLEDFVKVADGGRMLRLYANIRCL